MPPSIPKGTPKTWTDELLRKGVDAWVPPLPRYVAIAASHYVTAEQWRREYADLLSHHNTESAVLLAVIGELVDRLRAR